MGFFSRLRRLVANRNVPAGKIALLAPVSGEIVPIEQVPDVVFSEKIVGDGLAIEPSGNQIVAPVDGCIGQIFDANHAFSLESPTGLEIFVHFGIDTVELRGAGFTRLAEPGQSVQAGDPILEFDLDYLKAHAKSVLTPVVIANMEDVAYLEKQQGQVQAGQSTLFEVIL